MVWPTLHYWVSSSILCICSCNCMMYFANLINSIIYCQTTSNEWRTSLTIVRLQWAHQRAHQMCDTVYMNCLIVWCTLQDQINSINKLYELIKWVIVYVHNLFKCVMYFTRSDQFHCWTTYISSSNEWYSLHDLLNCVIYPTQHNHQLHNTWYKGSKHTSTPLVVSWNSIFAVARQRCTHDVTRSSPRWAGVREGWKITLKQSPCWLSAAVAGPEPRPIGHDIHRG